MKCVILAAGKGTRMGELSLETPKPMLLVFGKTLLEHKLDALPEEISEVIIVVGHLKDKITEVLGSEYNGRKIAYVEQPELKGTADSLWRCKELLKNEEKFLVLMGDDIYAKEDMEECLKHKWAILIQEVASVKGKAKVIFDEEHHIIDILEKYENEESGFINTGMYVLSSKIFNYEMVQIKGGEYGLPQTILLAKDEINIKVVKVSFYLQITSPEDLKTAEEFLKK